MDGLPNSIHDHPRYRIEQPIARGGMGVVYLANDRLMGRRVVIKTIARHIASKKDIRERFLREIRATAKLNHPNVIVIYDAEQTADSLFFVMEYLEGQDLHTATQDTVGLAPNIACEYVFQASLALNHAHRRGVIHRDIKPRNLFLVPDESGTSAGLVKVLDFGLAKVLHDAGTAIMGWEGTPAGFAMGTRGFMSPEQASDARTVGIHADIFSLGRTLYFLISGQTPYREDKGLTSFLDEEAGRNPVIPLEQICSHVPAQVCRVVDKMTARCSTDRFQSCDEVLSALAPLSDYTRLMAARLSRAAENDQVGHIDSIAQVQAVLEDCLRRRQAGEYISDEQIVANHPALASHLRQRLKMLAHIEHAQRAAVGSTLSEAIVKPD